MVGLALHLPWTEVVEAVNMQTSDVPHTRVWPSPRPQLTTTNINVILLVLYTILPPMNRLMRKWSMDHLSCMRPIIVTFPVKATIGSNEWTGTSSAPCHAVEQERVLHGVSVPSLLLLSRSQRRIWPVAIVSRNYIGEYVSPSGASSPGRGHTAPQFCWACAM